VVTRREITPELWVVRIRPEEKIPFTAGQYVTIGLPGAEKMIERPYSVASAPEETELEFFIELVHHGQLTPQLYEVAVGGQVYLRRSAKGRFTLDTASGHPHHLLVGTVTGVAPFVSIARNLDSRAANGDSFPYRIVILQGASVSIEFGYHEELTRLAQTHPWFHYVPTISRTWLEPDWKGEVGRCEDVVRKHLDTAGFSASDTTAYACGNPDMIGNVKGLLKRAGFAKESVREEVYWIPEKA